MPHDETATTVLYSAVIAVLLTGVLFVFVQNVSFSVNYYDFLFSGTTKGHF